MIVFTVMFHSGMPKILSASDILHNLSIVALIHSSKLYCMQTFSHTTTTTTTTTTTNNNNNNNNNLYLN